LAHVSFDFSYGVYPVLVSSKRDDRDKADFDFAVSVVHADGGVSIFLGDRRKGFQDGIRMQGIFDNVMGPGAGLGWTRERQCSRFRNKCYKHFVLGVGSGIKVYPRYQQWVKKHFDFDSNVETSPLRTVQMYLGLTVMWYL
jgi:hypothetical protein